MDNDFKAITFDVKTAQSLVDSVIESKGEDFVYKRGIGRDCLYIHRNMRWSDLTEDYVPSDDVTPGCIWGHALVGAGISEGEFEEVEGSDIEGALQTLVNRGLVRDFTPIASAWAYCVQYRQDLGDSWGEARDKANSLLHEVNQWADTSDEDKASWIREKA